MKYEDAEALLRDCKCKYIRRAAWKAIDADATLMMVPNPETGREYLAVGSNCPDLGLYAGPWGPHEGDNGSG
jgi:hypothetical protein